MKRILATVLLLCMLICMTNFSVQATQTAAEEGHSHCACSSVFSGASCASHNPQMSWQAWTDTGSLPTAAGNYYLTGDVQLKGGEPDVRISGTADVKLCLNGHSVSLAKSDSANAYRISVWDTASKLTIMDCHKSGSITGSSYGTNGAIYARGGELTLIGVRISGNTNSEKTATYGGGAIQIRNNAKVTAEYVTFKGNTSGSDGGAVCIKSGSLVAKNSVFTGNTAGISGGAIYLENNSCSASLTNCQVTDNTAAGAAIYINGATVTMDTVSLTGNVNNGTGGGGSAVHTAAGGKATLKSCSVTGNANTKVTDYAGALYVPNGNSSITVSGCTVVDNNTVGAGAKEVNVYLQSSGAKLFVGALTAGSKIGVTTRDPANTDDPNTFLGYIEQQDNATPIMSRETAQWIIYANKEANGEINSAVGYNTQQRFYFTQNADHWHSCCSCAIAGSGSGCTHPESGWVAWTRTDSLPTTAGNYYLTGDVQLKGSEPDVRISGTADVKLCLNGHSVSLAKSDSANAYRISVWDATSKLTIMDCHNSGSITGSSYGTNGALYARGGELTLIGVRVSGNTNSEKTATYGGGAIQIRNNAKVTAEYVTFSGNTSGSDGGAVCIKSGSLVAKNSVFTGNTAGISGGAVYLENSSCSASFTNCQITDNTAAGAAVYVNAATVAMDTVTITGNVNTATAGGGSAVHTAGGGKATLKNCTVTGNANTKATNYAGALYVPNGNSSITLSGRTVVDNNTVGAGTKEVNVFLQTVGAKLTVGQLTAGTYIGITTLTNYGFTDDPDVFMAKTGDITSWDPQWVVYENITAKVDYSSAKNFFFDTASMHWHTACACAIDEADCGHGSEDKLAWQAWSKTDSLPTVAGNYYLTGDVQLTGSEPDVRISGTADVKLCLNGYNISLAKGNSATSYRISVWDTTSKLTIMDCHKSGSITGSSYGTNGAIYARGGELTLIGLRISDNINSEKTAAYGGGAIQIRNGAKVTAEYVTFSNNTAAADGGAICIKNGSLIAKNTLFTDNTAGISGGAIYLENSNCSVLLENCKLSGNESAAQGSGIYGSVGSTLDADGITVSNNRGAGAAIYLNGAMAKLTSAVISENVNTADGASALHVANGSTAQLESCAIVDNRNTNRTEYCGGIYVPNGRSKLTISGCMVIEGNTVGGTGKEVNIFLQDEGTKLTVGQLEKGSTLGITTVKTYSLKDDPDSFMERAASVSQWSPAWNVQWVVYENTLANVDYSDGEKFFFVAITDHIHCVCSNTLESGCEHTKEEWLPWKGTDSLPTNTGNYYLTADVTLRSAQTLKNGAAVKLCLNGKTVTVKTEAASDVSSVYQLQKGTALTLSDCAPKESAAGKLTGAARSALWLEDGACAYLYGGSICANHCTASGGALRLNGNNTFKMYGGQISQNSGVSAGAIYANNNSVIDIYGGKIESNTAKNNEAKTEGFGGAVLLVRGSQLNLHGGQIMGNSAASGGAVYATAEAKITILGGELRENKAQLNGGAIGAIENSTVTLSGGTLEANQAQESGGAVYAEKTTVKLSGGKIASNTAKSGGGLFLGPNTRLDMTGGEVSANQVQESGGGIQHLACTANYTGGTVKNNVSKANGGGICTSQKCEVKLDGTVITGNTAAESGGGILIQGYDSVLNFLSGSVTKNKAQKGGGIFTSTNTTLNMSGGEVSGNEATKSGGGIQHLACKANYTGGTVKNNVSKADGGGICTSEKSEVKLSGTSITQNTAAGFGGGLLLQGYGSVLRYSSGTVSGNKAKTGGGLFISSRTTIYMSGGQVTKNHASEMGGGIQMYVATGNYTGGSISNNTSGKNGAGLCTSQKSQLNLKGTTIQGNEAKEAGGGVLLQGYGSVMNFSSGTVKNNKAQTGAGMYISTNTTLNMTGGTVTENTAEQNGGGIQQLLSTANYLGGSIEKNTAKQNGGGICTSQKCAVVLDGTKVTQNHAEEAGGGVLIQGYGCTLQLISGDICENTATLGAGLFGSVNTVLDITGGNIFSNSAKESGGGLYLYYSQATAKGIAIYDNTAEQNGGGVYSEQTKAQLTALTVKNNTAKGNGGGICTGQMDNFRLEDVSVTGNTAKEAGGGLYLGIGSTTHLEDVTITRNKAKTYGGALYAIDDLTMVSLNATDNKSGKGGAVYLDEANFDGRSYFAGLMIMAGDMRICDNDGPADLFIGEGTTLSVGSAGLGKDTKVCVTLASGVLTNTVFGAYDYEGGNRKYVITYGDRSLYELEKVEERSTPDESKNEPADQNPDAQSDNSSTLLLAVLGIGVAAIVAAILVFLFWKKNKKRQTNRPGR